MTQKSCDPNEVALKSFFLGPQAENGDWVGSQVAEMMERWFAWRRSLFPADGRAISVSDQRTPEFLEKRALFAGALGEMMSRFEGEVPKFSPRYIGHMFSEISLPAFFGHLVALLHNPNNISGESSKIGTQIEDEAISVLMEMMGFDQTAGNGHFTSGGTVANFEALLRARSRLALWLAASAAAKRSDLFRSALCGWAEHDRNLASLGEGASVPPEFNFVSANPWESGRALERIFGSAFRGPVVLVPENKHYSWKKGVALLGLGDEAFWPVALDAHGRLSISDLERCIDRARIEGRPVMMVVSVAGTTELGNFDPIHDVQEFLDKLRVSEGIHIWHHVDGAYGGFFRAIDLDDASLLNADLRRDLRAISRVDSVTLDPHKLGYVPFSCGAFLARSRRDYTTVSVDAPYLQFSKSRDRGPFTLEGSRSATGAAATWMIARSVGLGPDGYGRILSRTVRIRDGLASRLVRSFESSGPQVRIPPYGSSNILCFTLARDGENLSESNARALRIYEEFSPNGEGPFFVSKTRLNWTSYGSFLDSWLKTWNSKIDADELVLVRMTMMNPFFDSRETTVSFADSFVCALQEAII